jgi:hypothetical protein
MAARPRIITSLKVIALIVAILLPALSASLWIWSAYSARANPRGWTTTWDPYGAEGSGVFASSNGRGLTLSFYERGSQLPPTIQRSFAGFSVNRTGWGDMNRRKLGSMVNVSARYESLMVVTALPLIVVIVMRLLRRRTQSGCCASCGYDLRATPDRCPECGTVPAKVTR